ncbi:MAG: LytTR family DNA-binding domain-containing protein [Saprospiraceae bacterium]
MKTIIVDDEPLALEVLEEFISKVPELKLIKKCQNAIEAGEALRKNDIDLVFLDIQMPQLTGIEFVKSLTHPPKIIFTTAYSQYALEGFELNAVDYLLKPISFDRFLKAVNKAMVNTGHNSVAESEEIESGPDFIFVKADKKLIRLKYNEIQYVEGLKDYVIIKTDTGRIITLQTMKSLEEKLPTPMFMRIHRSYIVNLEKISAVVGNMVEVIEKGQPKLLPIGKNYRDELEKVVEKNRL